MFSFFDFLIDKVIELSQKIVEIQNSKFDVLYKDISAKDPLTTADLFANESLKHILKNLLPNSVIISEESPLTKERFQIQYQWIVDPIDGTRDFVKKKNTYSISIGLVHQNEPILGIVSMPAEGYLIYGFHHVEDPSLNYLCRVDYKTQKDCKIKKEFFYDFKKLEEANILVSESEKNKKKLESLPKNWNLIPTGSVARKLAMIAWGEADLMISLNPKNEWDVCAGIALIYASKQKATTLEEQQGNFKKYLFNQKSLTSLGLVAGNPYLVEQYLEFHKNHHIKVYTTY